ncbi:MULTISPECIES: type II 3-dehydroquinate dehydratase [unclassified Streptomyces]|uniref:type II 3-dehydroquinate dehydratase n=1 Tax=unclassified Streptomyces TaxID=2593676 RepID=UPI002DDC00C5|nr:MULTISPECIES: type II 3-dehydroquinate dehydratase [unclassified Streptomyces]WSA94876.1 type II 3-dehydroquinate dehydratase [Streptomyces sp. NBC_01795]WSB79296.1 type II 3-dehydroquinate dehydratase [Streptomyces sp. NBC_01775]WSS12500.1 type II 3-dehydroquinate dehydratase [Streptomyces sp. NBC_01186]WSS41286.1 type II 3-dehydroquinate dehydratase [Streptomyces sp. NBC_01187]
MNATSEATAPRVLLLHGPNLNLLGERDAATYGSTTLRDVEERTTALGRELGAEVRCAQSNSEGALIDLIHGTRAGDSGIVFNPGAYAHYSYALRDAIEAVAGLGIPCVEVHISNVHAREPFRHTSVTAPVCQGMVSGHGVFGYELALRSVLHRVAEWSRR